MGDVSLVDGWLPWVVFVAAPITMVLGLAWRTGRWRRQLLWGTGVAVGLAGGVAAVNWLFDAFPWSFPPSFYALAGLVLFAITVAIVGFSAPGRWRRVDSVVAVVVVAALVGVVVNGHYQYYPTVANLFGKVTDNELALPELTEIRDRVAATGQLPDKGYTVHLPIPGTESGFDARDAYVYLPPAWFAEDRPSLPALLMLHGIPGGPEDWLVGGQAADVADDFAARHDGKAPLLVMADATGSDFNDTECVNSSRGQVETYLTVDVPGYVDRTFGTQPGPAHWGVAGLSMGGMCALMLTLRHPDVFGVFGDYSGLTRPALEPPDTALADLFGGDQAAFDAHDPVKILAAQRFPQLGGWFEVGEEDEEPLRDTREVSDLAEKAGITTCVLIRPGGHDFDLWHQAFVDSLPWMSARLDLVPMPVDTHGATCTGP